MSHADEELDISSIVHTSDLWRSFAIMWCASIAFREDHEYGFILFTLAAGILCVVLAYLASVTFYTSRKANLRVYGCAIFIFMLFAWEHTAFVSQYGVPVIGHFFEAPQYDTLHEIQVTIGDSDTEKRAIGEISVTVSPEYIDNGEEDRFGMPSYIRTTRRDILLHRIIFPNGRGQVDIAEQNESLSYRDSTLVRDTHGNEFRVRLTPKRVHSTGP